MSQEVSVTYPREPLDFSGAEGAAERPEARRESPLLKAHRLLRGRYHWALLLALLGAALGGVGGYFVTRPIYQSRGLIRIAPVLPKILYATEQNDMLPRFDAFMDSQVGIIRSQRLIDMAMRHDQWRALGRSMSPEDVAEFYEALEVFHPQRSEFIGVAFSDKDPAAAMTAVKAVIEAYLAIYNEQHVRDDTQRMQTLQQLRTNLTNDYNGARSQIMEMAGEYGTDSLRRLYEARLGMLHRLDEQLRAAQMELDEAEIRAGAVSGGGGLSASAPPDGREKGTGGQAARGAPENTLPELSIDAIAAVDAQMRQHLHREQLLEREIESLQQRFGARHRVMVEAHNNLELARRTIESYGEEYRRLAALRAAGAAAEVPGVGGEAGAGALSARLALEQVRQRERRLRERYEKDKAETIALGRRALAIEALHERAATLRERLDEVKQRMEMLNVESLVTNGRMEIISSGDRPLVPHKDRRLGLAIAGSLGGGSLGLGVILLVGFLDPRFRNAADACTDLRHITLLGVLPTLPDKLEDPEQSALAAHCVHHIRTMLQIRARGQEHQTYVITSPAPATGKTSLSLALGLSFAASGGRTLLVDCDLVGGGLSSRVDSIVRAKINSLLKRDGGEVTPDKLEEALGVLQSGTRLSDMLVELGHVRPEDVAQAVVPRKDLHVGLLDALDGADLEECVLSTGTPGLYVLPLGGAGPGDVGRLSPLAIHRLLEQCRRRFNTVVVDTGPIPGSLEASFVAAQADGVVMVVSRGEQRPLAEKAMRHLETIDACIAGMVFNRAREHDIDASSYPSNRMSRHSMSRALPGMAVHDQRTERFGPIARAVALSAPGSVNGSRAPRPVAEAATAVLEEHDNGNGAPPWSATRSRRDADFDPDEERQMP